MSLLSSSGTPTRLISSMLGMNIHVLQLLLGHADPRTTEHSITLTDEVLSRCSSPIERLGAAPHRRLA